MAKVVRLPGADAEHFLQLRIELAWLKPAVWRRVVVPDTITLAKLHRVIQAAMGWSNSHLHDFTIGEQRYGEPDPDWGWGNDILPEKRATLAASLRGAKSLRYTYDFGDNWEHLVKIEKSLPPDPTLKTPVCLAGANACPPEDVGGPPGYVDFLDALSDPAHPEHDNMIEWCSGPFDPTAFDINLANKRLQRIKL